MNDSHMYVHSLTFKKIVFIGMAELQGERGKQRGISRLLVPWMGDLTVLFSIYNSAFLIKIVSKHNIDEFPGCPLAFL